jgi:hypothetical protein
MCPSGQGKYNGILLDPPKMFYVPSCMNFEKKNGLYVEL